MSHGIKRFKDWFAAIRVNKAKFGTIPKGFSNGI
jgi:hypothetical protein